MKILDFVWSLISVYVKVFYGLQQILWMWARNLLTFT